MARIVDGVPIVHEGYKTKTPLLNLVRNYRAELGGQINLIMHRAKQMTCAIWGHVLFHYGSTVLKGLFVASSTILLYRTART